MFNLTTILTLLAPTVIAPLVCVILLRALDRVERSRRGTITRFAAPDLASIASSAENRGAEPVPASRAA